MKCAICKTKKGKRTCMIRENRLICSKCCGSKRNIIICNSKCEYYKQEKYKLIPTGSLELTEVGRGKVTLFSESLFLPNILECLYMNINNIEINIKNPILISVKLKFEVKKRVERRIDSDEIYLKDAWKREDKALPFLSIYTIGTGQVENERLVNDKTEQTIKIENNHADIWMPFSKIENEKITEELRNQYKIPNDISNVPIIKGKHFIGKNNTFLLLFTAKF